MYWSNDLNLVCFLMMFFWKSISSWSKLIALTWTKSSFKVGAIFLKIHYLNLRKNKTKMVLIPKFVWPRFDPSKKQKQQKKPFVSERLDFTCTRDGTWTRTFVKIQDFKSCVSTNSTTQALNGNSNKKSCLKQLLSSERRVSNPRP